MSDWLNVMFPATCALSRIFTCWGSLCGQGDKTGKARKKLELVGLSVNTVQPLITWMTQEGSCGLSKPQIP